MYTAMGERSSTKRGEIDDEPYFCSNGRCKSQMRSTTNGISKQTTSLLSTGKQNPELEGDGRSSLFHCYLRFGRRCD
jgi:hypothetical protein